MPIVRVALDIPLTTLFDYTAADDVAVGQRVLVPFGRKQMVGVVMECATDSDLSAARLKPVMRVLDEIPPLPAELLALLRFCGDYYHHPLGMTVLSALPSRVRSSRPVTLKEALQYSLSTGGQALDLDEFPKRKAVQRRILAKLKEQPCNLAQLKALSATAGTQLKALVAEGWVESFARSGNPLLNPPPMPSPQSSDVTTSHSTRLVKNTSQVAGYPASGRGGEREMQSPIPAGEEANVKGHIFHSAHTLTPEQQQAVDAVTQASGYGCFLLHGVTGSGKTEVYVHLMHRILQHCPELDRRAGGQVLLLVPEINLTPQLENYFRSRFPDAELVSLHSGLADGERAQNWLRAQSGQARIVLGTRLAVFTPLPQLALIIVDEEHDASFKQQDGLRYSARDVAIFRANQRRVPIVLGSATPSLESYYNAQSGRYRLLQLTARALAAARLPDVHCINTSNAIMHHGISEQLLTAMEQRLQRGEQSLVFINRRGYAPVLMCTACGWLSGCLSCAGKLVLHLQDRLLRCHHCGHQERVPRNCPSCGNTDLQPVGIGTQRVESALQERFPKARILRVDRDSTRNKGAWNTMRQQIHDEAVDILVGTQMLAKGHDFPNLTLVCVLNPDSALYSSDFRASEKLFAQLAQVAGRAGRADKPGEVLVQTAFPDHPLFRALREHDYASWAQTLLAERQSAGFPPFVYQAMLRAEDKQGAEVYAFLQQARKAAIALALPVEVYGAVPAAMPRRANHIRAQLLVQCATRKPLQQFLRAWRPLLDALPAQKLRWSLDIDPLEF